MTYDWSQGNYNGAKGLKYYTSAYKIAKAINSRFISYTRGYNIAKYGVAVQYTNQSYTGSVHHVDIVYVKNGRGAYGNRLYGGFYNKFY